MMTVHLLGLLETERKHCGRAAAKINAHVVLRAPTSGRRLKR